MAQNDRNKKWLWLGVGTVFGLILSYYCPHEPAYAESASSSERFAMATAKSGIGQSDAVFVLDMVSGRLVGAIYSPQGGFTQTYGRNLAADFKVVENAQYVMVTGFANTAGGGTGGTPATGVIYVGELNSGIVGCYGFLFTPQANRPVPTRELAVLGTFPWRGGP
ncbi:MAG: hypothetical protein KDA69_10530 [Planctomycetaceae bacterium]|nr:hypothetical protein [Planctomycetaceae bacterium]MCA9044746.1 hypothetical protein [Planctomycetaceae bacterium]MCB9951968.1 hypothetical protein [Planctomycetaceae bacterium]